MSTSGNLDEKEDWDPSNADRRASQMPRHSVQARKGSVFQRHVSIVADALHNVKDTVRNTELTDLYEKAKARGQHLQRKKWVMILFEYTIYLILVAFVYFVLVGVPLWKGTVYWLYWIFAHKFAVAGTWAITLGVAFFFAYAPLFVLFEKDAPMPIDATPDPEKTPGVHNTALMIPCYNSAGIIGPTLEAAVKIFPPSHIFVIANGNSPTPLDNTEEVCRPYGVNHVWSPVGSKIVAQFVGCYAAKIFTNVLLIDDDCALPPNFPIVSERMTKHVQCIGYTIKSIGPESSRGTLCQQAQDLEYKISGIQRALAGKMGSATFPHGAISLWNTQFLLKTFHWHPGFSVSEDWFFGHVARQLGSRIQMCTSVFVETETPNAIFFSSGGSRGGFGEMTIFKQRFMRWNFFFVSGIYYNMAYILGSWKLGWWELGKCSCCSSKIDTVANFNTGAKLFVFQEVYETLLYLLFPFVLPISFIVRPSFTGILLGASLALYTVNVIIFNEIHLRLKKERVPSKCVYFYYTPYKLILTLVNVGSCYWSLYKYATYFARRHPKIIEDEHAVNVVMRIEESSNELLENGGRRMTVTAIGAQLHGSIIDKRGSDAGERRVTITAMGPALEEVLSPIVEQRETPGPSILVDGQRFGFGSNFPSGAHSRQTSEVEGHGTDMPNNHSDTGRSTSGSGNLHPVRSNDDGSLDGHERTRSRNNSRQDRLSGSFRNSFSITRRSSHASGDQNAERPAPTEFVADGYDDLLGRLARIEQRLNRQNVVSMEVDVGPLEISAPTQQGPDRHSHHSSQKSTSDSSFEMDDLKKENTRKTSDSRSMV